METGRPGGRAEGDVWVLLLPIGALLLVYWCRGHPIARSVVFLVLWIGLIPVFGLGLAGRDTIQSADTLQVLTHVIAYCAVAWVTSGIPVYWFAYRTRRTWHTDLAENFGVYR